jgi:hypothetical protein
MLSSAADLVITSVKVWTVAKSLPNAQPLRLWAITLSRSGQCRKTEEDIPSGIAAKLSA